MVHCGGGVIDWGEEQGKTVLKIIYYNIINIINMFALKKDERD